MQPTHIAENTTQLGAHDKRAPQSHRLWRSLLAITATVLVLTATGTVISADSTTEHGNSFTITSSPHTAASLQAQDMDSPFFPDGDSLDVWYAEPFYDVSHGIAVPIEPNGNQVAATARIISQPTGSTLELETTEWVLANRSTISLEAMKGTSTYQPDQTPTESFDGTFVFEIKISDGKNAGGTPDTAFTADDTITVNLRHETNAQPNFRRDSYSLLLHQPDLDATPARYQLRASPQISNRDCDPLTYSLAGDDAAEFTIDSTTGVLTLKATATEADTYFITVQARDAFDRRGGASTDIDTSTQVTVTRIAAAFDADTHPERPSTTPAFIDAHLADNPITLTWKETEQPPTLDLTPYISDPGNTRIDVYPDYFIWSKFQTLRVSGRLPNHPAQLGLTFADEPSRTAKLVLHNNYSCVFTDVTASLDQEIPTFDVPDGTEFTATQPDADTPAEVTTITATLPDKMVQFGFDTPEDHTYFDLEQNEAEKTVTISTKPAGIAVVGPFDTDLTIYAQEKDNAEAPKALLTIRVKVRLDPDANRLPTLLIKPTENDIEGLQTITVEFTDRDGATGITHHVEIRDNDSDEWTHAGTAIAEAINALPEYQIKQAELGKQIRVRTVYEDWYTQDSDDVNEIISETKMIRNSQPSVAFPEIDLLIEDTTYDEDDEDANLLGTIPFTQHDEDDVVIVGTPVVFQEAGTDPPGINVSIDNDTDTIKVSITSGTIPDDFTDPTVGYKIKVTAKIGDGKDPDNSENAESDTTLIINLITDRDLEQAADKLFQEGTITLTIPEISQPDPGANIPITCPELDNCQSITFPAHHADPRIGMYYAIQPKSFTGTLHGGCRNPAGEGFKNCQLEKTIGPFNLTEGGYSREQIERYEYYFIQKLAISSYPVFIYDIDHIDQDTDNPIPSYTFTLVGIPWYGAPPEGVRDTLETANPVDKYFSRTEVTINITPVDEPTVLECDHFDEIEEYGSTTKITSCTATDPEGTGTWSLSGEDAEYFELKERDSDEPCPLNGSECDLHARQIPSYDNPPKPITLADTFITYEIDINVGSVISPKTITVLNVVNDPRFEQEEYTVTVPETAAPGTIIETIRFTDPDPFETPTVSLTKPMGLVQARHFNLQEDDAKTYSLVVAAELDFEARPEYKHIVKVDDGNQGEMNTDPDDSATITITIEDVDEPPLTSGDTALATDENLIEEIGEYTADDPERQTVYWTLGGDDASLFQLTSQTGSTKVKFRTAPDFESPGDGNTDNQYDIEVNSTDGLFAHSYKVTVTVRNTEEAGTLVLDNTSPNVGDTITATLTDPDGSLTNVTYSWEISDGTTWSTNSGESRQSYKVLTGNVGEKIRASVTYDDGYQTGNSIDSNPTEGIVNRPPAFNSDTENMSIAEGSATNAAVGQVTATDPDAGGGDSVSYSSTDIPDTFTLIATTGAVILAEPDDIDHEDNDKNRFEFTVTATDTHDATDSIHVTVNITNTNEIPVISGPASINFPENSTDAVARYTAIDPEDDTLTWELKASGDSSLMQMSGASLEFKNPPDYETPRDVGRNNVYNVIVQAYDGGLRDEYPVAVTVTNIDEAPGLAADDISVEEGISIPFGDFEADNEPFVRDLPAITLEGGDGDKFDVVTGSGSSFQLKFKDTPDFEAPHDDGENNVYDVTIKATDNDGESKTSETDITVTVTNKVELPTINETKGTATAPVTVTLPENTSATGKSYTADSNGGGDLSWTVTPSSAASRADTDGAISFDDPLPDYETMGTVKTIDLVIEVTNSDGTDTAYLKVTITDANDPGIVTLDKTSPKVGETITATLADQDGAISDQTWQWQRSSGDTNSWADIDSATSATYSVRTGDVGFRIRASTEYDDRQATDNTAVSDQTGNVPNRAITFSGTTESFSVSEAAPNGHEIGSVTASDPDSIGGDTHEYSVADIPDAFAIDSDDGQITVADTTELDYEDDDKDNFTFTVTATDDHGSTATISVTITVTDHNEAPAISGPVTKHHPEGATAAIGTYTASDPEDRTVTWDLSGDDAALFSLSASRVLTFKAAPDREDPKDAGTDNVYNVTIEASDGANTTTRAVTVTVTNVDEDPDLDASDYSTAENTREELGPIKASDEPFFRVLPSITLEGDDGSLFDKVRESGETFYIRFKVAPDHENPSDGDGDNDYEVAIKATDTANRTKTVDITVTVTDTVELPTINEPKGSSGSPIATSMAENIAPIGKSYTADSNGGGDITWTITASPSTYTITRASAGALAFAASKVPNYEDMGSDHDIELTIEAENDDGSDTAYLTVTITDAEEAGALVLNDASPNVGDSITATLTDPDGSLANITYSWEISDSTDPDNITWSTISGETSRSYKVLTGNVGEKIRASAAYDDGYQTGNSINSDPTGEIVNRPPTFSTDTKTMSIAEESATNAAVGQVTATDPDAGGGDSVTYSSTDIPDTFTLNATTGAVILAEPDDIDHEDNDKNRFEFTVTATDTHDGTDSIHVTVNVLNVNEKPAINTLTDLNYHENSTAAVVTVTATDEPLVGSLPDNVELRGDDKARFHIANKDEDAGTFDIEFRAAPDYENPADNDTGNDYELTVHVSETGSSFEAEESFTVTVTDATETPTILNDTSTETAPVIISIRENQANPNRPYTADSNGGGDITWSITPSTTFQLGTPTVPNDDQSRVRFTFRSGQIPDYDTMGTDKFVTAVITATNEDESDTAYLRINITDVNEAPIWSTSNDYTLDVDENSSVGTTVGTVTAADPEGGTVTYSITTTGAPFNISNAGKITVKGDLDHETTARYTINVRASDSDSNTEDHSVVIDVNDVNEAPEFPNATETFPVSENASTGHRVGAVAATDVDDGDTISYTISTSDEFQINAATGTITLKSTADLDYDDGDQSYTVTITATDSGTPGLTDTVAVTINVSQFDETPSLSGPGTVTHAENNSSALAAYTADDPEDDDITWTLTGSDAAEFTIIGGSLKFKTTPDFENPVDDDDDSVYAITVNASDGTNDTQSIAVSITVTDVDEPPAAPTISITDADSHSVDAAWNTPTNTAKPPVTGFDVHYRPVTDPVSVWQAKTHNGAGTRTTISGLTANTSYEVSVRAKNDEGVSPWATPTTRTTDPYTVQFQHSAYSVTEGSSLPITLTISPAPTQSVEVRLTHSGRDGANTADYSGVPASVTFTVGDTVKSFTIQATDDAIDDDGESVRIELGTLPAAAQEGTNTTATVSITDNDGAGITVSPIALDIDEGDSGNYTIKLDSQPTGPVTITISTPSGSGLTPDDSSITFSTTNWASPQTVTLTASDDNDSDDHTVVVTQTGSSTDDNYNGRAVQIPTVVNDDDIDVQFGATNYSTYEDAAVGAMVTITLAEPAASTLIIPLLTRGTGNDGAMAQPGDWSGIPATVTFNSGNDVVTFEVLAVADTDPDPNEAVVITLGTLPNGAARGTPASVRVDLNNTEPGGDIVIEYTLAEQTMQEGESITITARISRRSSSPVTVPIVTRGSKHFHFDEYSEVPGEFHFPAGQNTQSFEFTSIDDAENDPDAFVKIGFHSLPNGVVAGVIDTTVITIEENDFNIKKTYGCNPDSGQIIILEETGNISQAGETDFWKVDLDPWRVYIFEVLGADSGVDVIGQDTHPGDLTLSDPDIVGSWNADRSTRHAQYGKTSVNNRNSIVVDRSHTAGVHQIEVGGNSGTGTYQIKVRVNNVCYEEDGVGYYHWFGGPDGYVLDIPADTSTNFTLRPHSRNIGDKATGGFLGDNPAWYWDQVPDEDWIAAELRTGYEYTIEISTSETYPLRHQATDLTILGIHDHEGTIIPNTASPTSGKQITVVFRPTSSGNHYIAIGGDEDDRTGGYNIQVSATAEQTANQMSDNTESITASFSSSPEHHDGPSKFQVRVEFSEDIETSYRDLPDAFTVEGGSMGTARRVNGSSSLWELNVTPTSDDPVTITLAGSQDCAYDRSPCTSDGRTTGETISVKVAGPQVSTRLTAQFVGLPTQHDGSTAFEVRVQFSHDLRNSYSNLHQHPTVTSGSLNSTSRVNDRSDLWKFKIEPNGNGPITFAIQSATQCDDTSVDQVPCSEHGRPLSISLLALIEGPTLISVADATTTEAGDATFKVSLTRAATETITVDYSTGDGTATTGSDYTAASGTLTFLPTEQTKNVIVTTLSDEIEETTETFTLTLSNPSAARIVDATGTGSIEDDNAAVDEQTKREDVTDLGDITDTSSTTYSSLQSLDGEDQTRNWYTFTLTAQKRVQLGIRQLDADATITLEDQDGNTLQSRSATDASSVRFGQDPGRQGRTTSGSTPTRWPRTTTSCPGRPAGVGRRPNPIIDP